MLKKLVIPALFSLIAGKKMQLEKQFATLQGQECPLGEKFFCPENAKFCSYPVPTCYEGVNSEGIMKEIPPISTFPTMKREYGNWCPIGKGYYCGENCSECSTTGEMCFCKNENNEVTVQKPSAKIYQLKKNEDGFWICPIPGHPFYCPDDFQFCMYPPPICFNIKKP